MNSLMNELTDNDFDIIVTALKESIAFLNEYIKENKCPPLSQPYENRIIAKEALTIFEFRKTQIKLNHLRFVVNSLSDLKSELNDSLLQLDITPSESDSLKETRRHINHSLRVFRSIFEEFDEDFDVLLSTYSPYAL